MFDFKLFKYVMNFILIIIFYLDFIYYLVYMFKYNKLILYCILNDVWWVIIKFKIFKIVKNNIIFKNKIMI